MTDENQQPEELRPIPDGGLKDSMPEWLKRPPAWRNMPTAEQRHERTLPEPDTSVIDPRTLVDVTDLPQWLQSIAARGTLPVPDPDGAVDHAVEQVQAVATRRSEPTVSEPVEQEPQAVPPEPVLAKAESDKQPEVGLMTDETVSEVSSGTSSSLSAPLLWGIVAFAAIVAVLIYILI